MKQFDLYVLDTSNACLWRGGVQIFLAPKPFEVLRYLVDHPGRLVTHDELLDALWPETYVQPQVLRTYMLELRKVLGDEADHPRFIQTQPKRGYRFVAAVKEVPAVEHHGSVSAPVVDTRPAGIIGRDEELARLHRELQALNGGQRRILFVTGETGIGKTSLVDAFCRQLQSSGTASVAHCQCVQGLGSKEEYYPVIEALSQLCVSPAGEAACRTLARMAPAWLPRLDCHAEVLKGIMETRNGHERMPGDLCRALEELAATRPLVLAFEDLHWADNATLDLVAALARRLAKAKLMVVATYVPGKLAPDHPLECLKRDLLMHHCCAEIAVRPLAKRALAELLSRELDQQSPPPAVAEFVHNHSVGNPLFALAVLDHLIAEGYLVRRGNGGIAHWEQGLPLREVDSVVPHGLFEMIELEIARLSSDEQCILEAGSLVPVAFPAWAVAAALEHDAADTEETCDALARRLHFVARAGEDELPDGTRSTFYAFTHGLYREVLYQRQAAPRRARRHMRIAEQLGKYFAGREADVAREMALHYEAAGNWKQAAAALRSAAHHADERQAYDQAAEILERALSVAQNLSVADRDGEVEAIRLELESARVKIANEGRQKSKNPSRNNLTVSG
jgi:predicted ATPase/DNA-binding winged helix-turn-helix (wHTH) protein